MNRFWLLLFAIKFYTRINVINNANGFKATQTKCFVFKDLV